MAHHLRLGFPLVAALADPALLSAQLFGPAVNLSQTGGGSHNATVAVDGGGRALVMWHDFTSNPNQLWCGTSLGNGWNPSGVCAVTAMQAWTPRLVSDPQGNLHAAWRAHNGVDDIYYAKWSGGAWSPPINLSSNSGRSATPSLAVDVDGHPHVLWEDNTGGSVSFYEAHFDGSVWSAASDTGLIFQQGAFFDTIRIAVDAAGTVHAVWHDGPASDQFEIYHAERPVGGSWTPRESVSREPGSLSAEPTIAVSADQALHCAWVQQDRVTGLTFDIFYARKPAGGAWSVPVDVSQQDSNTARPWLGVSASGEPSMVWTLGLAGEVFFVPDLVTPPVNLSLTPGESSARPVFTVDASGDYLVAWQESVGGNNEIVVRTTRTEIVLMAVKDTLATDVELFWTGGFPNFAVGRSPSPDVIGNWTELTPPGGIPLTVWTDSGVVPIAPSYFYQIR